MQEREKHYFHPLVIFNRLFNFIMNTLIARGLKRIILGRPISHASTHEEEAIDGFLSSQGKTENNSSSEIVVEFKHGMGLEHWTPMDKLVSSDEASPILSSSEKGDIIEHKNMDKGKGQGTGSIHKELPLVHDHKSGVSINGASLSQLGQEKSGSQEIEPISTNGVRARVSKRVVSIGDYAEEREKNMKKEKGIAMESEEAVRMNSPRHVRPLLNVAVNINEKSDEFIRSRKEAMRRNYNHA